MLFPNSADGFEVLMPVAMDGRAAATSFGRLVHLGCSRSGAIAAWKVRQVQHGVGSFALLESVCLVGLMPIMLDLRLISFPLVVLLEVFVVMLFRVVLVFEKEERAASTIPGAASWGSLSAEPGGSA